MERDRAVSAIAANYLALVAAWQQRGLAAPSSV
jgi:hypothetical protein